MSPLVTVMGGNIAGLSSAFMMSAMVRTRWFPLREEIAFFLMRIFWTRTLKNLKARPWFRPASVHGNAGTLN